MDGAHAQVRTAWAFVSSRFQLALKIHWMRSTTLNFATDFYKISRVIASVYALYTETTSQCIVNTQKSGERVLIERTPAQNTQPLCE